MRGQQLGSRHARMTEIYVDADACPVKDEVLRVAERHQLKVWFVGNQGLRQGLHPLAEMVVVPDSMDAADDWIAEHVSAADIAITADIPLAGRCLSSQAIVLGPTGRPFTEQNIGNALGMRDLKAHLRETGEIRGLNPAFTKADRSQFLQALEIAVRQQLSK